LGDGPGDFEVNLGNTGDPPEKPSTTTPSSTSTSTSSSSSGGGSAEPKVDPIEARKLAEFQSVYSQLWGEPATEAYLKNLISKGFNRWEMEDYERNKPAFMKTETYRDEATSLAEMLAGMGVIAGSFGKGAYKRQRKMNEREDKQEKKERPRNSRPTPTPAGGRP
jgi:hypothetical protein